ncbi:MAG: hypothetical protein HY854_09800 [Burkholderiales bacterium]|nr:hypothetical protein [Burkholderiales bacterium]
MLRGLAALLLATMLASPAAGEPGRTPKPVIEPAVRGAQCVADPAFMRRNHMDLLKHQRDDTVREGKRLGSYSLKGCIECHASPKTGSVAKAETNFCVSCHQYAAVRIDCFECHASRPGTGNPAFHRLVPPGAKGAQKLAAVVRRVGAEGIGR